MISQQKNGSKGSVLIEGVLVVFILVLSVIFNLELYRRINYEVLIEHAAFIRARDKIMGVSETKSRLKICALFDKALGIPGLELCQTMQMNAEISSMGISDITETIEEGRVNKSYSNEKRIQGIVGSIHIRYPQYINFKWNNNGGVEQNKTHLEITRKCPYPTSSY